MSDGDHAQGAGLRVGEEVRSHIGERLRAHYDAVLKEPIPDRFLELLQSLDGDGTGKAAAGSDAARRRVREGQDR